MAYPLSFLLSDDAAMGRAARAASYARGEADLDRLSFVVHAETAAGMVELDAESAQHAETLALTWLEHFGAMSCAVRAVAPNGKLVKPCRIYDWRDTAAGREAEAEAWGD